MEADLEREVRQPLSSFKHEQPKNSWKLKDDSTRTSLPQDDEDSVSVTFNAGQRPYRDSIFAVLFLGTILVTFGFGIVAFTRADFNLASNLRLSKFNRTTNECEFVDSQPGSLEETDISKLLALIISLPTCALVLAFPVGVLFLWLLHRYPRGVVLVVVPLMTLFPLGIAISWFTWCYGINETCATELSMSTQISAAFYCLLISSGVLHQLWKERSRTPLEITIQLLKMVTSALKENFLVMIMYPVVFLGFMATVCGPIVTFIWYAFNNGKIAPNFDVVNDPSKGCDQATGYPCCQIDRPEWFTTYVTLAYFILFWVLMVTSQLQMLVVSGTISQWYFAPTGSSTIGNMKHSLRNALGPSFGTACNLGTIVTILGVLLLGLLKKATNRVLNSSRQGMFFVILQGCFSWMLRFPECNPRFAANFAAISGDSFWESSKKANSLLQRNSLCTTMMKFSLPAHQTFVGMKFIYVFLQTLTVYGVLKYGMNTNWIMNFEIAVMCSIGAYLGLTQFQQAIGCVIDTVYICYAMEKEVGEISKPEVCHVYMLLPPLLPENGGNSCRALDP